MGCGSSIAPSHTEGSGNSSFGTDETLEAKKGREEAASIKITSAFRALRDGRAVRKAVVMPSEIEDYLRRNLDRAFVGFMDFKDLSRVIAREILEPVSRYRRVSSGVSKYRFPFLEKTRVRGKNTSTFVITSFMDLWINKIPGGVEFDLVGKEIGRGALKTVYNSKIFGINLETVQHTKTLQDAVLLRSKPGKAAIVLEGLSLITDSFSEKELKNPNLRVAGLLNLTDRMVGNVLEARDAKYDGDLTAVALGTEETLRVIKDVAITLFIMHGKKIVHRDVKPENILVKDGRGYLADFDFAIRQGKCNFAGTFEFMDVLSHKGHATPFTDIYGLAKTLEVTVGAGSIPPDLRTKMWAVFKVNTWGYINAYNGIAYDWCYGNDQTWQTTFDHLNRTFPEYQDFLHALINLPSTYHP